MGSGAFCFGMRHLGIGFAAMCLAQARDSREKCNVTSAGSESLRPRLSVWRGYTVPMPPEDMQEMRESIPAVLGHDPWAGRLSSMRD
ncbi:protein of unknown function [Candidatus Nitrospira inopinata]|uniref:Uncharacterized protein n=1 Tax=Candidatus Nitrospira inopinata TaxID=1715989 RepID=A0A0S4KVA6_9BACT|nr:protein of unknown function [Candidatus Nitrospira inopinata]